MSQTPYYCEVEPLRVLARMCPSHVLCFGQIHWGFVFFGSSPTNVYAPAPPPLLPSPVPLDEPPPAPPPPTDFDLLDGELRWMEVIARSQLYKGLVGVCVRSCAPTKNLASLAFASDPRSRQICKSNSLKQKKKKNEKVKLTKRLNTLLQMYFENDKICWV